MKNKIPINQKLKIEEVKTRKKFSKSLIFKEMSTLQDRCRLYESKVIRIPTFC